MEIAVCGRLAPSPNHGLLHSKSDYVNKKIQRYWVQGPKRNTNEDFLTNCGSPINIKRAANDGEFWVAVEKQAQQPTLPSQPQGLRVNGSSMVLQTVPLTQFLNMNFDVVQESNDALYVGSSSTDFIGVYTN